ncbi:MAG: tol-pal system protein YbgF [Gammaproteobacteria bacterium]|nr:tol-pal system protein YbgF [Gammaproteobacteria bacterium]MCF6229400.1 tol-pal system protein YbgF [Gammaproteobacteria bacterium]
MDLFKHRLPTVGVLFAAVFSGTLSADVPVVDLTAKPQQQAAVYVAKPLSVEQRLSLLERKLDNDALIDLYQRLDALQLEVQQLRGEQEQQQHGIEGIKQRQRSLYIDLDQRIGSLQKSFKRLSLPTAAVADVTAALPEGELAGVVDGAAGSGLTEQGVDAASNGALSVEAGAAVITPLPVTGGGVGVADNGAPSADLAAAKPPEPINPLQEQSDYQKALDLLMAGNYEQSITAFSSFLQRYPTGEYQQNAQYWLGEAYYVSRLFDQAIESFSQVIADKSARKRPDAMLKSGYSLYEQKRWGECREILQQLINEYPQSAAAGLAEQRIQMLRAANL